MWLYKKIWLCGSFCSLKDYEPYLSDTVTEEVDISKGFNKCFSVFCHLESTVTAKTLDNVCWTNVMMRMWSLSASRLYLAQKWKLEYAVYGLQVLDATRTPLFMLKEKSEVLSRYNSWIMQQSFEISSGCVCIQVWKWWKIH